MVTATVTCIVDEIGVLPFPVWLPDCCSVVDDDMLKKTVVCTMLIMNCWSQSAG